MQQATLSKDVLTCVMVYLDSMKDLRAAGQVCTEWRQAHECTLLWQPMYYKLLAQLQYQPYETKILQLEKSVQQRRVLRQDVYHQYCIQVFKMRENERQAEMKRQVALEKKKKVIDYVEKREASVWTKIINPTLLVTSTLFPIGILLKCLIPSLANLQPLWFAVFVLLYLFLLGLLGGLLFSQIGSACASCVINSRGYKEDWFFFGICHTVLCGFSISSVLLNVQLAFQYDITKPYWNWWVIFSPIFASSIAVFLIVLVWIMWTYEFKICNCAAMLTLLCCLPVMMILILLCTSFFILLVCKLQYVPDLNWAVVFIPLFLYQVIFFGVVVIFFLSGFKQEAKEKKCRFTSVALIALALVLVLTFETLLAVGLGVWCIICLVPVPALLYTGSKMLFTQRSKTPEEYGYTEVN